MGQDFAEKTVWLQLRVVRLQHKAYSRARQFVLITDTNYLLTLNIKPVHEKHTTNWLFLWFVIFWQIPHTVMTWNTNLSRSFLQKLEWARAGCLITLGFLYRDDPVLLGAMGICHLQQLCLFTVNDLKDKLTWTIQYNITTEFICKIQCPFTLKSMLAS